MGLGVCKGLGAYGHLGVVTAAKIWKLTVSPSRIPITHLTNPTYSVKRVSKEELGTPPTELPNCEEFDPKCQGVEV